MKKKANLIGLIIIFLLLIFQIRIDIGFLPDTVIPAIDTLLSFFIVFLGTGFLYAYLIILLVFYGIGAYVESQSDKVIPIKFLYETDRVIQDIFAVFLIITGSVKFFIMETKFLPLIFIALGMFIIVLDLKKLKTMFGKMKSN